MADLIPDVEPKNPKPTQDAKKGKKKQTNKMSLGEFMGNEGGGGGGGGSWADSKVDWAEESAGMTGGGRDDSSYGGGRDGGYGGGRDGGYGGGRGGDRDGGYGGSSRDGGYGGGRGGDRDGGYERREREPTPVPNDPPFVAYVGNLVYDVTEEEITTFFSQQCTVTNVRLVNDYDGRPKGFGYIEFGDRESLVGSLEANGMSFCGRAIRVDVADQKDKRGGSGFGRSSFGAADSEADTGPWRRGEAVPASTREEPFGRREGGRDGGRDGGFGGGRDGGRDSGFGGGRGGGDGPFGGRGGDRDRSDRDRPMGGSGGERPKLKLAPRSKPANTAVDYSKAKSNPFGAAKPRDESAYQRKKEEAAEKPAAATTETADKS